MIRLILSVLIALSLAGTGPAIAAPADACPMEMTSSGMNMDHEQMGCCAPGCAVTCPPAVVPDGGTDLPSAAFEALPAFAAPGDALHSVSSGANEPPPRPLSL